jgi:hypothetical protein
VVVIVSVVVAPAVVGVSVPEPNVAVQPDGRAGFVSVTSGAKPNFDVKVMIYCAVPPCVTVPEPADAFVTVNINDPTPSVDVPVLVKDPAVPVNVSG